MIPDLVRNLTVPLKPPRLSNLRVNVTDIKILCQGVDYGTSSWAGRTLV